MTFETYQQRVTAVIVADFSLRLIRQTVPTRVFHVLFYTICGCVLMAYRGVFSEALSSSLTFLELFWCLLRGVDLMHGDSRVTGFQACDV